MAEPVFDARYYADNYRDYREQNPPRKLRFYAELVEAHRDPTLPRRIHDLGCGFGLFLAQLAEGWQRHGSDVSEHAIERAAAECPGGVFRVAAATTPPAGGERFAVVTAFDVIEHVPDPRAALDVVHDQLLPGGLFLFVVPVYDGLSGPLVTRLDRDPTHLHKWPRARWLELAHARFEPVDWLGIVRYGLPTGHYLHWPTRRLRRHAPALCVACRRPR